MKQKNNNIRSFLILSLIFFLFFLTGCWSSRDIEEKNLVTGLALDIGKKSDIEKKLEEREKGYSNKSILTMTFPIAKPQSSGQSRANAQQKPYENVSETGESVHLITREIALRRKGVPLFSHIKVVVISEDLLRLHSLEALLDLIFRDNELRASCLVLISKGFASKILESNAKGGFPSFELIGILDNKNRSTRILPSVTVANLTGKMGSKSSFLIQNVSSAKGEIKVTGGSIIKGKNKKIVGYFNAKEIDGLTWITGQGKRGLVRIYEEETGQPIVYEIKSMKSKIIPHVRGKNISFNVNIESEGRISENWLTSQRKMTNEFLKKIEKEAEKEVNLIVNNVLEKAQKEYQVDVFGFGNKMRIEYPKTWEKLKGNWDKTFSEIPIKCKVKLIIKDYGGER